MTSNDTIKDITVVFPSEDFYFDSSDMMSCQAYKVINGTLNYIDKECFPLNNRIHIKTMSQFNDTDGIKIKVTNVPNPIIDSSCLHHA